MQGIYNNYQEELDALQASYQAKREELNKRIGYSINMMMDLLVLEHGKHWLPYSDYIKLYIENCPLENKINIIKQLDDN